MCLFQLHPFMKSIQFTSPAGEQVNLDLTRKVDANYNIVNLWNFPEGLRLRVKVGEFFSHSQFGQYLAISEDLIEWATEITEVRDLNILHGNKISKM